MKNISFDVQKESRFDVVVCGGGCAGVVAAIAAARKGAKVAIVERNSEIGGSATASLVGPFMTCFSPDGKRQVVGGIFDELVRRMEKKGGAIHPSRTGQISSYACYIPMAERHNNVTPFHPGYMSMEMAEMLEEAGVQVFLNNIVIDATTDETKKSIEWIATYDGRQFRSFEADVFIDATGDAVLSEKAGVECLQGTDGDVTNIQPMTLFFWIYNVDDQKLETYLDQNPEEKYLPFHEMIEEDRKKGYFTIPRNKIGLYHMVNEGEWRLNTTRLQGYDPCDPDSLTAAYFEGLKQISFLLDYFKKCPGLEQARLGHIGSMMGIRESRRIVGEYVLAAEDLAEGVDFEDTIALCSYPIDMHPAKGNVPGGGNDIVCAPVYAIPYRVMLPKNIDNLLVAGRCISASREALAAVWVMPPVMAMGQAAGVAAALAAKEKVSPKEIKISELREQLKKDGAAIDL